MFRPYLLCFVLVCHSLPLRDTIKCENDCFGCHLEHDSKGNDRCAAYCKDEDCAECDWCPKGDDDSKHEGAYKLYHWTTKYSPPPPPPPPGCQEWCNSYTCAQLPCRTCDRTDCHFRCEPWCAKLGDQKCARDGCEGCTECKLELGLTTLVDTVLGPDK
eukprot:5299839-Pleurochrysis_carterae.AAC.3